MPCAWLSLCCFLQVFNTFAADQEAQDGAAVINTLLKGSGNGQKLAERSSMRGLKHIASLSPTAMLLQTGIQQGLDKSLSSAMPSGLLDPRAVSSTEVDTNPSVSAVACQARYSEDTSFVTVDDDVTLTFKPDSEASPHAAAHPGLSPSQASAL